jgi:hypothetical protein
MLFCAAGLRSRNRTPTPRPFSPSVRAHMTSQVTRRCFLRNRRSTTSCVPTVMIASVSMNSPPDEMSRMSAE